MPTKKKKQTGTIVRVFNPHHEKYFGLRGSIFLAQLNYWLRRSPHVIEGKPWIYNTYADWCDDSNFPHWKPRTVKEIVRRLKKVGVLLTGVRLSKAKRNYTNWYSIDYDYSVLKEYPLIVSRKKMSPKKKKQRTKNVCNREQKMSAKSDLGDKKCSLQGTKNVRSYKQEITTRENKKQKKSSSEQRSDDDSLFHSSENREELRKEKIDFDSHSTLREFEKSRRKGSREDIVLKMMEEKGQRFAQKVCEEAEKRMYGVEFIDKPYPYRLRVIEDILQNPTKNKKFYDSFAWIEAILDRNCAPADTEGLSPVRPKRERQVRKHPVNRSEFDAEMGSLILANEAECKNSSN